MGSEKTNEIIKELIVKCSTNKTEITDKTNLLTEKVLDSITFVKLVSQLEKTFNIEFSILDLTADKFKTIELISTHVKEKTGTRKLKN